jgi:hypothetical protein
MTKGYRGVMTPETEEWRPVPGYEGHYEASDQGGVRNVKRAVPRVMLAKALRNGYPVVSLWIANQGKVHYVHRLVAAAFLGACPAGQEVRHLDDNKADPRLVNLVYGTRSENVLDRVRNGIYNNGRGGPCCLRGHLFDDANTKWDKRGRRSCRTCFNATRRIRRAALRESA